MEEIVTGISEVPSVVDSSEVSKETKETKPGNSNNSGIPSTALEASTMDLVPDHGILNGLDIEIDEVQVQNILSLTSALPNLEKIK